MDAEARRRIILAVDDSADNLALLSSLLKGAYKVKVAISGEACLEAVSKQDKPDLILLDVVMPGMDGYEVCSRLKLDPSTRAIPVIFLTAKSDPANEEKGLGLGAVDYIAKPFSPPIVLARIATHLQLKGVRDFLLDQNAFLEEEIARRTMEVGMIQDVAMIALGSLAETRDNETGNHIRRTQHYIKALAERLKEHPKFRSQLSGNTAELLYKSAPLHDIGKVGIPDSILKKPGKLDRDEFEVMKTHAAIGRDAILAAESRLDSSTSFLSIAREIAWSHHERWDGSGYPRGLAGDAIPFPGRLMSVPDVYDALISRRVYKPAFGHEEAMALIREGSGTQFDPDIASAFASIESAVREIARAFADP